MLLLLHEDRELARRRSLAAALESAENDDGRRSIGVGDLALIGAEQGDKLIEDDLDDLLSGIERLRDLSAKGALLDLVVELPHHREVRIGVEQGQADLSQSFIEVTLGKASPAAEPAEHAL